MKRLASSLPARAGLMVQPKVSPSYCHIGRSNGPLPHKNTFNHDDLTVVR
jgi:hypothetical protein